MEHDLKSLFKEKIRTAERQPANWNKYNTWQLVEMSLAPQAPSKRWIYAAASTLILVALVSTDIVKRNPKNKPESNPMAASVLQPAEYQPIEKECELPGLTNTHPIPKTMRHSGSQPTGETPEPQEESKTTFSVLVAENTNDKPAGVSPTNVLTTEPAVEVKPVEPIIGIIISPKEEPRVVTEKKIRFKLFKSPGRDIPELPDTDERNLFARIN